MMSNPIYDMMKQVEIQKDIAEIHAILSGYENVNGRNRALDMQASEKIREMQGKDLAIYAVTAPKPGTPGIILLGWRLILMREVLGLQSYCTHT